MPPQMAIAQLSDGEESAKHRGT